MRPIDADELKKKLQEHHDFFLMAWNNSTVNMPKEDKARLDEISNCIAEVINAPTVEVDTTTNEYLRGQSVGRLQGFEEARQEYEAPKGHWVENKRYRRKGKRFLDCSVCHYGECGDVMCELTKMPNFCPNCGAKMKGGAE